MLESERGGTWTLSGNILSKRICQEKMKLL